MHPLKLDAVRAQFPILRRTLDGAPLVYLDNAATTLKPDVVIDAEARFYREIGANVHSGLHALSSEAGALHAAARERVARFLGARSPREVIFTPSCTSALNTIAHGLALDNECAVITTANEHHSTLLPWFGRAQLHYLTSSPLEPLDPEMVRSFASRIRARRRVLVLAHASNVTGLIQPVRELCQVARELDMLSVIDAAQSAPHLPLDVAAIGCDYLVFAGHKALGPMGTGVLYGRLERLRELTVPQLGGGSVEQVTTTSFALRELPERLEAGSPNVAGVHALACGLDLLTDLGWPAIAAHAAALRGALLSELQGIRGLEILTARPDNSLPIASLAPRTPTIDAEQLCVALSDNHGIMTRAGLHCAHPLFAALGIKSALRVSAYVYNTEAEMHMFGEALHRLLARLL